jgi:hypothetical protein
MNSRSPRSGWFADRPERNVKGTDVVCYERFFVTLEFGTHLGDYFRQVDLHSPILDTDRRPASG